MCAGETQENPVVDVFARNDVTLRDYLASAAMTGICANPDLARFASITKATGKALRREIAERAYRIADEMIAVRDQVK